MRDFRFRFSRPVKIEVQWTDKGVIPPPSTANYDYVEITVVHHDYNEAYNIASKQFEHWRKTPKGKEWYDGG